MSLHLDIQKNAFKIFYTFLPKYRERVMIFAILGIFRCFMWILTIRNTIFRYNCWFCRYKLSEVIIISKSRRIVSHQILPFSVRVQTILITGWQDLGFIFLWLMKSILRSLHCTTKNLLTSLAFLENLSLQGIIL